MHAETTYTDQELDRILDIVPANPILSPISKPKWKNNIFLMCAAIALMIMYAYEIYNYSFNFDIWYMLSTGREILENGIPYENPFAQVDGMHIIIQQWMLCVLVYLLYTATGFSGLAWWTVFLAAVLVYSLYRLGRLKKRDSYGGELILVLILISLPAFRSYMTMCSSIYSMIAFTWVVFFLEEYRKTGKYIWLAFLIPLAILHAGFHMSFATFDLVIIACYMIPDIFKPLHKRGLLKMFDLYDSNYRKLPILFAFILVAAALCLNPYGIEGAMYIFLSYGAADYGQAIPEMQAFTPFRYGLIGMSAIAVVLLSVLAIGKRGMKSIDLPLTILVMGTVYMMFDHTRSIWLPLPFGIALISGAIHGWSLDFAKLRSQVLDPMLVKITSAVMIGLATVVVTCQILVLLAPNMSKMEGNEAYSSYGLVETLKLENIDENTKVFNPVRLGGYLEWSGIPVFVDSRVEIWNSTISGSDKDYYYDYVDMEQGKWTDEDFEGFLAENEFDYLITQNGDYLDNYLFDRKDYRKLVHTDDYNLWVNVYKDQS